MSSPLLWHRYSVFHAGTVQQVLAESHNNMQQVHDALSKTQEMLQVSTALQPTDAPLTHDCELLFHSIVLAKLHQSSTGCITAQGLRGRPVTLLRVPHAEKASNVAAADTVKRRSQLIEQVHSMVSCSKKTSLAEASNAAVMQQASLIRRNSMTYLAANNVRRKNAPTTFRLDQLAALSAEMPLSQIATLKRMFTETLGYDPFASLAAIREKRAEMSFQYECSSFTDGGDHEVVNFLRVTDVATVLQQTVNTLHSKGLLEHLPFGDIGELRLLLPLDKGGCSTKLVLQVLNSTKRHSTSTARLPAFFRGGHDNYENIKEVFYPVIKSLFMAAADIAHLQLTCPPRLQLQQRNSLLRIRRRKRCRQGSKMMQRLNDIGITAPNKDMECTVQTVSNSTATN